ncbi:putative U3 small nucleolar RNA-associated protein 13 [Escovopsis weberi]|uniref:Putative U3 small nucleolar RNA-associated protein 13 n=1 Tax=Escovopsis weberi TaxID=150374 RepID=A0A0M8N3J7_ESCWE|nr:putative U3 small nucleolar RNA-associated protein 13 [Escovopsis weberi]
MATKQPLKTTFDVDRVIRPIYTGGSVAIDNGARILVTTLGEDVVLTDPSNGKHLAQIDGPHTTPVVILAVDRTSTLLATGGTDGVIKVWDIAAGYVTHTFRGPSVLVSALKFFEVAARANQVTKGKKNARTDQADEGKEEEETTTTTTTNFRLASGSQDGKVRIWDLHKKSCIANLDSHVSDVQSIDYSPAQHAIVTASRDKTIIWWDAKSWKIRKIVPCLELLEAVGFLDDGNLTYSAGANGCLRIWDTDNGHELTPKQSAKNEQEGIVAGISRPELPFILLVQANQTLAFYGLVTKADATSRSCPEPLRRISGNHDDIIDLGYLLPDRSLLALATNSEDIRLVSVAEPGTLEDSAKGLRQAAAFGQDVALLSGHEDIVISLDIDWSGHWIVTGAKDNTARVWRVDAANDSYACWATFSGHAESLGAVALPRGLPSEGSAARTDPLNHPPAFLLTGSQDQTIKKWEIPRNLQTTQKSGLRALFTRKAHDKDINAINVHHAGQLFASASQDKTIKIWSVEEGEVQGILRGHKRGVWSVQFSPANLPALQGEDGPVTGKGVVLTGSGDKSIKLWSLSDYTCIRTFEGHSNSVLKVVWLGATTQDQTKAQPLFASAGGDGLVKVWNANSGETECTLDNHEDRVWALAVHPKTNTLVSGSGDSTVSFWKDTTSETQAAASQAASQLIEQEQELENHIHAGSYREAITLALQLNHPGRLLGLFTSVVTTAKPEAGSLCGIKAVDEVIATLSDDQIYLLLLRLRDWNTNARTAPVAQRILWALIKSYPASKFSNLSVKGARGEKSLKEVLHGLRVYTERHYKRMEELVDESYLVEYTLQEMDNLAPALEDTVMAG